MTIKTFADTSAVSLAYAMSDAHDSADSPPSALDYVPLTTEGFKMSKDPKMSTAITNDRRVSGSKNTKGSSAGAITVEFGFNDFCKDFLAATLMSDWVSGADSETITDSNVKKYMLWEKTIRPSTGATDKQSHEDYFGQLVNDATLTISPGDIMTYQMNLMGVNAEYKEAVQGSDGMGGSLVTSKNVPAPYELADSSNNIETLEIKDANGSPMEMTFSNVTLKVTNNVREQDGVGSVFASGMGLGKANIELSGTVYYYDQSVLDAHMSNKNMSASFSVQTAEGTYAFNLPRLKAQAPDASAQGENQDYSQSLTLMAERGTFNSKECMMHVEFTPA